MKRESIFRRVFIANTFSMDCIPMSDKTVELGDIWNGLDSQMTERIKNDPELLDLFERYKTAYDNFVAEEVDVFYEVGIKLGVRLGMEFAEDLPQ